MQTQELLTLFVQANEFKEGDLRVGGTQDPQLREAARRELASLSLQDIHRTTLIEDGVSVALKQSLNDELSYSISHLKLAEVKHILLSDKSATWAQRYRNGLGSEAIAALAKIMTNEELAKVAQSLFNPLPGTGIAIGSPHHLGSRIQPNSPGDDEEEVLLSILEGLSYGCGDVILGINPASDDVDSIVHLQKLLQSVVERLELPTRYCVLSDIVKQTTARASTPVDVGFQSLAGTAKALNGMVGLEVDALLELAHGFNGLYYETGQGAEITNNAAEGVDMVTLESRTYGLARYLQQATGKWTIVNDVAGFIGPEVFRSEAQLLRACLEDSVMAKLHGLTMGLDVCATFHMGIAPAALQQLTERIASLAAPAYLMAVAGNADPMLGYLTTSFREHPRLRQRTGKKLSSAMRQRLTELGMSEQTGRITADPEQTTLLYAQYRKNGGATNTVATLQVEGRRKLKALQQRGYDLGYGCTADFAAPPLVEQRLEQLYRHARTALYATLNPQRLTMDTVKPIKVQTNAIDRDDYIAHPYAGEQIRAEDLERLRQLYPSKRPYLQIVLSDGLNADALNENLGLVLPALRHGLGNLGLHVGDHDIVIANGRLRAGYHIGTLLDIDLLIHFIGERPGTGLNTLSAYLTYGRDAEGRSRWHPDLDHAWTTAICGIHRQGKRPELAVDEILRVVMMIGERRRSGVALGTQYTTPGKRA